MLFKLLQHISCLYKPIQPIYGTIENKTHYQIFLLYITIQEINCQLYTKINNILKQCANIIYYIFKKCLTIATAITIIYIALFGLHNISYTKKFKIKTEYYQEDKNESQNGLSLTDPLKHSSTTFNQSKMNVDVSKFTLEVIASSPQGTYCLINKKILSVGDILDNEQNIKILEIRDDSILIGNHDFRHVIAIH